MSIENDIELDFDDGFMRTAYGYRDIQLIPQKCVVGTRTECDTKIRLGKMTFDLPVYASNMKSVVNEHTCKFFAKNNMFYTMHRFGVDSEIFCTSMLEEGYFSSISVGINEVDKENLRILSKRNIMPDYITIDVANAWSDRVRDMMSWIKDNFDSFLIVGNVATSNACLEIESWGADAIKVGIANGKVCITRNKTGFCLPMVSSLLACSLSGVEVPLIADGGIVENGDIAKAIASGGMMVMAGSLFAGYDQSAGEIIEIGGTMYKDYYGSASMSNKTNPKNIEGKKIMIPYKGNMSVLLKELKEDLQSSISYSGGSKVKDLKSCNMIVNFS